jgi:hypothetical protein
MLLLAVVVVSRALAYRHGRGGNDRGGDDGGEGGLGEHGDLLPI